MLTADWTENGNVKDGSVDLTLDCMSCTELYVFIYSYDFDQWEEVEGGAAGAKTLLISSQAKFFLHTAG